VLSFLAFTGHLLCCEWSLMDQLAPERSDAITLLCCSSEMTVSRGCCLSGCGFPPYRSGRLLLTFLMALRIMVRTLLSHSVVLGCISSSGSYVGEMRVSSPAIGWRLLYPPDVYLLFNGTQVSERGECLLRSQRGSLDVKLISWKLGSCIPLLGRAGHRRSDFIIHGSN